MTRSNVCHNIAFKHEQDCGGNLSGAAEALPDDYARSVQQVYVAKKRRRARLSRNMTVYYPINICCKYKVQDGGRAVIG